MDPKLEELIAAAQVLATHLRLHEGLPLADWSHLDAADLPADSTFIVEATYVARLDDALIALGYTPPRLQG